MTQTESDVVDQRLKILLLAPLTSAWNRLVLRGVASYAHEHVGWQFYPVSPDDDLAKKIQPGDADGIVADVRGDRLRELLDGVTIPTVNVSWFAGALPHIARVVSDERECGRLAAEHLLEKGFRNLAYVGPDSDEFYPGTLCDEFLARAQTTKCRVERFVTPLQPNAGRSNGQESDLSNWLKSIPKPVGILTWNSRLAREITALAESTSMAVPDRVALLSAEDDPLLASLAPIPLSNIDQSPVRVGYEAAACLHELIHRPEATPADVPRLVAPLGIVQRESTNVCAVDDAVVTTAMKVIREQAHRPIQVVDLYKAANVSRRVLEQRFQELLGRTPATEIRHARLGRVKRLLIETDWTVAEIASNCGFNHPEVMIRMFRREVGVSPTAFRRKR